MVGDHHTYYKVSYKLSNEICTFSFIPFYIDWVETTTNHIYIFVPKIIPQI